MSPHEEINIWAWIVAIVAGSNWAFGNRPVFGRQLQLRSGIAWRVLRWSGLAVFAIGMAIQNQSEEGRCLALMSLISASVMLIGTARMRRPEGFFSKSSGINDRRRR